MEVKENQLLIENEQLKHYAEKVKKTHIEPMKTIQVRH